MKLKLNHRKVREIMVERKITPSSIAGKLQVSRQMASYIINRGGPGYAPVLSKALKCSISDIILNPEFTNKISRGLGMGDGAPRT